MVEGEKMEVAVQIDKLTDCLVDRQSGAVVRTEYHLRKRKISPWDYKGWKFNWSKTEEKGYCIYELFVSGLDIVQGRIALKIDGGVADIDIVETAPHNYGHNGRYEGVGGHLFAIACQVSLEAGCDGFAAFTSKSDLIEYYQKTLNAKLLRGQRMYIDDIAAKKLIEKYIKR